MTGPPPPSPRRVHPVTPLVHGATAVPVALVALIAFGGQLAQRFGGSAVLVGIVGSLLVGLLVAGLQFLAWQRLAYWFDADGDLRVDSGVLARNERRLQLSRLQSVDIVQPLVARIFSMAQVRVEVAGAGDSRVTLSYLTLGDAQALRNEVLARAAGLRHDAGEAPERVLVVVPTGDLVLSLLMRSVTVLLLGLSAFLLVVAFMTAGAVGVLGALVTGGVPLFAVFAEFARYFNFTVAESPDGLRLRFGLLQAETRTVPPGRVQAVEYVEPLLWRRRGWVRVRLTVAGSGGGNDESTVESVLLPVAPMDVARGIVAHVLPGVDVTAVPLRPTPDRSSRRSPVQWSRLAVGWDADVFVARRGRITRQLAIVPHVRTQSVRVTQGPWERWLGLASVHVDTAPGPVKVVGLHRDAAEARAIADEQADRARAARAAAPPQRWLAAPPPAAAPAPPPDPSPA